MTRPTRIYIFVTSDSPDPYVNVIVIALRLFDLREIHFVSIAPPSQVDGYDGSNGSGSPADQVAAAVRRRLEELSRGVYSKVIEGRSINVPIRPEAADKYKSAASTVRRMKSVTTERIRSVDLDAALARYIGSGGAVFDVTAFGKKDLVDVVSLMLSRGGAEVRTFEIRNKPREYNENDLFYALAEDQYSYSCLTDGDHVDLARRRMTARSIAFRNMLYVTLLIFLPVLAVQFLWPKSWLQTMIVGLATAVSVATWLLPILRKG